VDPVYRARGHCAGRLRFMVSWNGIVDLLAIAPFYISFFVDTKISFAAAVRIVRFFRLLKFDSYTRALGILSKVFTKEKEVLLVSGFYCVVALLLASSLLYLVDGQFAEFATIPEAMHTVWMLFMGTFPYSNLGTISKIIVSMLLLVGLTLVWVPLGIVSAGIVEIMTERRDAKLKKAGDDDGDGEGDDDGEDDDLDHALEFSFSLEPGWTFAGGSPVFHHEYTPS